MSGKQWCLLLLLIASIFLNYVDRGTLSLAVPFISTEFSLSSSRVGSLSAAFFWTYALLKLSGISGSIADRFPAGYVLAAGLVVWSSATIASGMAPGFVPLFIARLLLGAGESLAYPCYSRIFASEIGAQNRGIANSLLDAGSKLGPALGALASGLLLARYNWRIFFVTLGAVSLLWLAPWMFARPLWTRTPEASIFSAAVKNPRTVEILRSRSAWATFLGHFCGNYFWFFLLTWPPTYLIKYRGFSIEKMAKTTSLAYGAMAGATVLAGWVSDRWIRSGASPSRVRKSIVVGGLVGSTVILPVSVVDNSTASITFLVLACIAFGIYASNHWAITQTLAGPHAAGRWTSLQNGVGNLSGIAAAWITGIVVDLTNSFGLAFIIAAGIAVAGAVFWGGSCGPCRADFVETANKKLLSKHPENEAWAN